MDPLFFQTPADFRKWLQDNHDKLEELWVGFYKKGTGRPSITWPESVDQALCYGWIDGLRKSIDEQSYKIRFTPRKTDSHWSAVNIRKVGELKKLNLMQKPGLVAFKKRNPEKSAKAAYEQREAVMDPGYEAQFKKNHSAWSYWDGKAPSYRKQCTWWVMSAKKVETQVNRLQILIKSSEKGEVIPQLKWGVKK